MNPTTAELLAECVDALKAPAFDSEPPSEHLGHLERAAALPDMSASLRRLFFEASRGIVALGASHILEPRPKWIEQLIAELEAALRSCGAPRLLYHGTICGRLESIKARGLVPGAAPVWKNRADLRKRSDEAVFFEDTWRGATNWAYIAQAHARGPRSGPSRRMVVIRVRVPAKGLSVMPDKLRGRPGAYLIEGEVSVAEAHILQAPFVGFPSWTTLSAFAARSRSLS